MRTFSRWRSAITTAATAICAALIAQQTSAQLQRDAGSRASVFPSAPPPRLVVFITVDQFRGDYLKRFGPELTGGLGRLVREGAVFPHGRQDHAITETAPGHAATMSGRFPRGTGIVRNSAGVYDPQAKVIGGGGDPASPFRFRGSVLFDWIRSVDPDARALSVSRKDRGAILPLGRAKQQVYWYADTGRFTTSQYYADTLPEWVRAFNDRRTPARYAGTTWNLLSDKAAYPEPDSVDVESGGRDFVFPHAFPSDSTLTARLLPAFPVMDSLTLAFAVAGLRALRLGDGDHTDILAVSLSTTDAVGHRFGPESRELHDQILHLDRYLTGFLDSILAGRRAGSVAIALTSDHGIAPLPELHVGMARKSAQRVDLAPALRALRERLTAAHAATSAVSFEDGVLFVNRHTLAAAGLRPDSIIAAFADDARETSGVLRVDRVADLAHQDTVRDAIARRWLHQLPPDVPAVLVVTLKEYNVWGGGSVAVHGSPHDYDVEVPVLFWGPWFTRGRYEDVVRVVDMAPTLAAIARVTPTEPIDGHALVRILR
ncbi:MAG: alkaline phosphatase family protein [Gemmatimonadaceae bacterium]